MKHIVVFLIMIAVTVSSGFAELPTPESGKTEMILGDRTGDYYTEVKLYYESADGMELTSVTRNIYVPAGSTVADAAIEELFGSGDDMEHVAVMPENAYVRNVYINGSIVTVDLNVNISSLRDEGELVALVMAVTNTLTSIDGIEYVNVLINGRAEAVSMLPLGVQGFSETATSTVWSVVKMESGNFAGKDDPFVDITRNAVLYFPSSNGQWVLPEVRSITFENEDYALRLINELMAGPSSGHPYLGFIASGANVLETAPVITVTDSGKRVLEIRLNNIVRDYLMLQGIPEWQFVASITMTMTSFVPDIGAVRILIDGEPVNQLNIRGHHRVFEDGCIPREAFSMYAGTVATLYFSDGEGGLRTVDRAISSRRSQSPHALVTQLIAGPSSSDMGAFRTMPAGVSSGDLLGVSVVDGICTVNMSANFYRLCQAFNEEEEQLAVFSIINTLCEIPGINAVSIIIEGEQIENLSGSVYLFSPLLPNPGIITE